MFNYDGIRKTDYTNPNQILANVEMQASVGCIVSQSLGVAVSGRMIAKAGTPIHIDLMARETTPVIAAAPATPGEEMNAVLLHNVDVTDGNKNGAALLFGFVNVNRLESDVQTKLTPILAAGNPVGLLTFMKA